MGKHAPKGVLLRISFLAFFALVISVAGACQQGQQKGLQAGGTVAHPPVHVPNLRPGELPPYPPGAMSDGHCQVGSRGFILELSDNPAFRALVQEDLAPWTPQHERTPADEKAWIERMKGFVPLLLKGLESENGCIQLEAVSYLAKLEDPRAVEPLYRLVQKYPLDAEVACEAVRSLAVVYNDRRTIPHLVSMIEKAPSGPVFYTALDAASRTLKDERLWHALANRFENTKCSPVDYGYILQAAANQEEAVANKQEVTAFFRRNISRPGVEAQAVGFAVKTSSPDAFDELAAYYRSHCQDNNGDCWGTACALIRLGGPKLRPFWLQEMREAEKANFRTWAASQALIALEKELPAQIASGDDLLALLDQKAGEALPIADQPSILGVVNRAPEVRPDSPPERRAAYWEKAAKLLERNKPVHSWIGLQLYQAYGPGGIDNPEKALSAITMALEDYSSPSGGKPGEWLQYKSSLERRLRTNRIGAAIQIQGLEPSRTDEVLGPWKGNLVLPEDAVEEVISNVPFAYLDFIDAEGRTTLVETEMSFPEQAARAPHDIAFLAVPKKTLNVPPGTITGVRLRLLFLPRATGFTGHVTSSVVRTK